LIEIKYIGFLYENYVKFPIDIYLKFSLELNK